MKMYTDQSKNKKISAAEEKEIRRMASELRKLTDSQLVEKFEKTRDTAYKIGYAFGRDEKANFDKKRFLRSDMGKHLENMIKMWDEALTTKDNIFRGEGTSELEVDVAFAISDRCIARWEVYKIMFKHFYNLDYYFTRTDEYFGICTENESEWLYKFYKL